MLISVIGSQHPFSLPLLQSRIVARVASLRRLCADLRPRLTASQSTQAHLAEALVQRVAQVVKNP